jgi:hypothetical protein
VAVDGAFGAAAGLKRANDAMAAAVLVLHQGLTSRHTLRRGAERTPARSWALPSRRNTHDSSYGFIARVDDDEPPVFCREARHAELRICDGVRYGERFARCMGSRNPRCPLVGTASSTLPFRQAVFPTRNRSCRE